MESTIDIRKKIHEFIDQADERILHIINEIITTDSKEKGLSENHKAILDERLQEHLENPTSGKSWNDVRQELRKEYGL